AAGSSRAVARGGGELARGARGLPRGIRLAPHPASLMLDGGQADFAAVGPVEATLLAAEAPAGDGLVAQRRRDLDHDLAPGALACDPHLQALLLEIAEGLEGQFDGHRHAHESSLRDENITA